MKRIFLVILTISLLSVNLLTAQNPFKDFGYEVGFITLSKGKYIEFIPYDSLQHIGSIVINIKTGKIVELVNTDSVELGYNYRPDVPSRWISPDPLAEEYWSWSPYNYTMNNPINLIDPNGMYVDTYIYDLQGNYVTTIDDDLDNQIVFMDNANTKTFSTLNKLYGNADKNGLASLARGNATAIFSQNTANQLQSFYNTAYSNSSNEPGGILWINPENKELQVWGMEGSGGNTFSAWNMIDGGVIDGSFIGANEIGGKPFAAFHGHPGSGFQSSEPTDPDDYTAGKKVFQTNNYFKQYFSSGLPGLIVTGEATTIYPMNQNVNGLMPFTPTFSDKYNKVTNDKQWGVYSNKNLLLKTFWEK